MKVSRLGAAVKQGRRLGRAEQRKRGWRIGGYGHGWLAVRGARGERAIIPRVLSIL